LFCFSTLPVNARIEVRDEIIASDSTQDNSTLYSIEYGDLLKLARQFKGVHSAVFKDSKLKIKSGKISALSPCEKVDDLDRNEIVSLFPKTLPNSLQGGRTLLSKKDISLLGYHLININSLEVLNQVFFSNGRVFSANDRTLLSTLSEVDPSFEEAVSFDIIKLIHKLDSKLEEEVYLSRLEKYLLLEGGDYSVLFLSQGNTSGLDLIGEITPLYAENKAPRAVLSLSELRSEVPESSILDSCKITLSGALRRFQMEGGILSVSRELSFKMAEIEDVVLTSEVFKDILKIASLYEELFISMNDKFVFFFTEEWYLMCRKLD